MQPTAAAEVMAAHIAGFYQAREDPPNASPAASAGTGS